MNQAFPDRNADRDADRDVDRDADRHADRHADREAGRVSAPLSEREREILDFEREWWKYAGAKDAAILEQFAMTPGDYYQTLNRLIDDDAAVQHDSLLVRRLRRQRLMRQRQRSARRLDRPE